MSGVLIIAPVQPATVPVAAGTGAGNLLTASPREIWVAPSSATVTIDVDMGAAVPVDSFFLGYTNADAGASWTLYSGTGLGAGLSVISGAAPLRASDSIGPRHHAFHRLAAPVVARYFRLSLTQSGGVALQAGVLILGKAFERHRELGGGRMPLDTGARQALNDGGFGVGSGVVKSVFSFSFIDLSDADLSELWAIAATVGLRRPVVVVEDADLALGRNEAIHYGVFERFQPYARQEPGTSRWAFSHEEWR